MQQIEVINTRRLDVIDIRRKPVRRKRSRQQERREEIAVTICCIISVLPFLFMVAWWLLVGY